MQFLVEKAKNGRKVAGICFKDEHSKKVFKSVSELVEFVKKSGVSNSVIQETTKELVNAELQRNNSEKDDSNQNNKYSIYYKSIKLICLQREEEPLIK